MNKFATSRTLGNWRAVIAFWSAIGLCLCGSTVAHEALSVPSDNSSTLLPQSKIEIESFDEIKLVGKDARFQLLVDRRDESVRHPAIFKTDVVRDVQLRCEPAELADIDVSGLITPKMDGRGVVHAFDPATGTSDSITIVIEQFDAPKQIDFTNQVIPILTKYGCNGGGCHGKAAGQNGFKLSLLGFEPADDYDRLAIESRSRRVSVGAPDESLLLTKATNRIPHGGGARIEYDSHDYRILRRWISQGLPEADPKAATVVELQLTPAYRSIYPYGKQQIHALAVYSDGYIEDVTRSVQYDSNDGEMADVDARGLVTTKGLAGEVAVMGRYQGQVAVARIAIPINNNHSSTTAIARAENDEGALSNGTSPHDPHIVLDSNAIRSLEGRASLILDQAVESQLNGLNIPISERCDDATFLRRVCLDITAKLPDNDQLQLLSAGKLDREALIDDLLSSDDYATYFASKWSKILRNRREKSSQQFATFAFFEWIEEQMRTNRPYDQFVREIVTASGSIDVNPPVAWYRSVPDTFSRLEDVSQLFLGQRIQCARCHHHPQEKWGQQDYYQLAAFFTQVRTKSSLYPDIPFVFTSTDKPQIAHPKSGAMLSPVGLGSARTTTIEKESDLTTDAREQLADWMTERNNPFFAKSLANRYWKHFLGRGLVEPEDDMRATNPPSNPELMECLAQVFKESSYDLKSLIKTICLTETYQRSSIPTEVDYRSNLKDQKCYSRYFPKRLSAETLIDAIDDVTKSPTVYQGLPRGTRAVALPDNAFSTYFLRTFGSPDNATACECERSNESTLSQSLHVVNSTEIQSKLGDPQGFIAGLSLLSEATLSNVQAIYLRTLGRQPTDEEALTAKTYVESKERSRISYEDLVWTLITSKEFSFNH